jgi:NTE family protein
MPSRRLPLGHLLAAVVLTVAFAPAVIAQPQPSAPSRPRIGLCLAGGGARGGAHVGVLRVLEELQIPVDYIAGTSIGSIIGGLYASGYSPQELETVVATVDWGDVFHDSPPRQQIEYRRKMEDRLPYFDLELGVNNGKVRLASGLIAGQKLNFLLRRLCMHTTGITDFDDLSIPYRAIAADLADGSMVVLDHGSLADALRASMSIPGAFTPHEIEGRVLVDGGMVRNLPYDVVKSMGADVVIAVDVGTPVGELSDEPTFLGVVMRTLDLATKANVAISRAQFTDADLLMIPDLGPVTTASFPLMAEAAARGEAVARANIERLRKFSVPAEEYAAWRAGQRAGRRGPAIRVADVKVVSPGRVDPRRIARRVKTRSNAPLDFAILQDDLTRVYRMGEFQSVDFRLENPNAEGTADLVLTTREKPWGPNYLRIGLSLADHFNGDASYNLLFYHRLSNIDALGAEWRNQLALGNRLVFDSEFYQPVTFSGRFFAVPRFTVSLDKYKTFDAATGRGVNAELDRLQFRGELGVNFAIYGEARAGVFVGTAEGGTEDKAIPDDFDDREGGWRAGVDLDQLDSAEFPRHGWAARGDLRLSREALGADLEYDRASLTTIGAATRGRLTFLTRLEGGTSFKSELPIYSDFELGGFTHLSGLEPGRLQGDEYTLGVLGTYCRIGKIGAPLGGNIYLGLLGEVGRTWKLEQKTALEDLRTCVGCFLGAETLLGPIYLGYGLTDGGEDLVYFYLGKAF